MQQHTLIDLVATFNQNNPSFAFNQTEKEINQGVHLVEAISTELRRLGASQETIDTALTAAMRPKHMAEMLQSETKRRLGLIHS